jgi:3-hydroxyacyl-CoA dehydrogenase
MNDQNIKDFKFFDPVQFLAYLNNLKKENERLKLELKDSESDIAFWKDHSDYWSGRCQEIQEEAKENLAQREKALEEIHNMMRA